MVNTAYVDDRLRGGESFKTRKVIKVIWFIGTIVFIVLAVTSILEYNARIAEAAEYLREKYGISDTPDVDPFLATPLGRLLVFYGFALFISGLFVWQ